MSKAVISNRIYMNCDKGSDLDKKLMKELTYELWVHGSEYPMFIHNMIRISDKVISIPSGRLDLIPEDRTIVDKRADVPVHIPKPGFVPRDTQAACIDQMSGNGLVDAPVGWGKSIVGLGIAYKLQQKTLIICTTTTIRDMWVEEIKKWFGFEPGIIGGGKFNTAPPIVVGNIQTIRNRTLDLQDAFGLVIVDEVHRSPAKTFTDTLNTLKAKVKIGLSGTLIRKDGMHCVLEDYFGKELFVGKVENVMLPTAHLWDTGIELSANEFIPWSTKISQLMGNELYRAQLLELINNYAEAGHIVLVLCDRTEMLEYLHEQTKDFSLIITGKITGAELRQSIMDAIADPDTCATVLYATQSIFSEGVSLNELSCVILGTPINNEPLLVQISGRVMRQAPDKLDPVIVDMGLTGNTGKRHRNSRRKTYIEKGWKIKNMGSI